MLKKKGLSIILALGMLVNLLVILQPYSGMAQSEGNGGIIAYDDFTSYIAPRLANEEKGTEYRGFAAYQAEKGENPNGGYGFHSSWQAEAKTSSDTGGTQPFIRESSLKNGDLNKNMYKYLGYFYTHFQYRVTRELSERMVMDGGHDYYASAVYYLGNFQDASEAESRGALSLSPTMQKNTDFKVVVGNDSLTGGLAYDGSAGGLVAKVTAGGTTKLGTMKYRAGLAYRIIMQISPGSGTDGQDIVRLQVIREYDTPKTEWDVELETTLDQTLDYNTFGYISSPDGNAEMTRSYVLEKYAANALTAVADLAGESGIHTIKRYRQVCDILPEGIGRSCILSAYGANESVAYEDARYAQTENRSIYNGVNIPKFGFSSDWSKTPDYPYSINAADSTYWKSFHNYDYWFDSVIDNLYARFGVSGANDETNEPYFAMSWPGVSLYKRIAAPIDLVNDTGVTYLKTRINLFYSDVQYVNTDQRVLLGSSGDYIGLKRYASDNPDEQGSGAGDKLDDIYVVLCINGTIYKTDICISSHFEDSRKYFYHDYMLKIEPTGSGTQNLYLKVTQKNQPENLEYDYVLKNVALSCNRLEYIGFQTPSNNGYMRIAAIELEHYDAQKAAAASSIVEKIDNNRDNLYFNSVADIRGDIANAGLQDGYLLADVENHLHALSKVVYEDFAYGVSENTTIEHGFNGGIGFQSPWAYDTKTFDVLTTSNENKNVMRPGNDGTGELLLFVDAPLYRKLSVAIDFSADGVYYLSFDALDLVENRIAGLNDYIMLGSDLKIGLRANTAADSITGYVQKGEEVIYADKPMAIGTIGTKAIHCNRVFVKIVANAAGTDQICMQYNRKGLEQSAWDMVYETELSGMTASYLGFGNNKMATVIDNFILERCEKQADDALNAMGATELAQAVSNLPTTLQKEYFSQKFSFQAQNKVELDSMLLISNALQDYEGVTSTANGDAWLDNGMEAYVNVKNASAEDVPVAIALAIYDAGRLETIKVYTDTIPAGTYSGNLHVGYMGTHTRAGNNASGGAEKYGTPEAVPVESLAGKTVRVFCWNGLEKVQPLGRTIFNTFQ